MAVVGVKSLTNTGRAMCLVVMVIYSSNSIVKADVNNVWDGTAHVRSLKKQKELFPRLVPKSLAVPMQMLFIFD